MPTLVLHDLTLTRGKGGFALGPIDLGIDAAAHTALVGPSGSGKTTLLRLLAGLERPERGSIRLQEEGQETVWNDAARLVVSPAARGIGFVFQDGALWPHMTALAHLRFVDPRASKAEAEDLLAQVGLSGFAKRRPDSLSGGERQRLALARALAGQPRLLLLDEPLHSVDVHLRDELSLLIQSIATQRGIGLVVVTHDRRDALALATEMVVLHAGRVIEQGVAANLVRAPRTAFTAAFLGGATCIPVRVDGDGRVQSPFGTLPAKLPAGAHDGDLVLALLPDDIAIVAEDRATAQGRVLRTIPEGDLVVATVQLGGHVVHARCGQPSAVELRAGQVVGLSLRRPARVLGNASVAPTSHADARWVS